MQKTMITSAGILLVGILIGAYIVQPSMYTWRNGMMFSDDKHNTVTNIEQDTESNQPRGMGMMHNTVFVTSERAFIEQMVPHHKEAITTAEEVLEGGGMIPGMVGLANNIVSSQTKEVALMTQSYEEWFGEPYQDTGEYEPMMRDLAPYSGVALDRVFLQDMTVHHMRAIMMSRSVQPYLEHETMRELTDTIVVNQSREIETMRELFTEL